MFMTDNEGWGLGLTESLTAGRMIIAPVQGGMQDQMRFEDENGDWIKFYNRMALQMQMVNIKNVVNGQCQCFPKTRSVKRFTYELLIFFASQCSS